MDKLLKELYYMLEENVDRDFERDPEYKRCAEEADKLWDAIAADLGTGGNARLNDLVNAQAKEDQFWRFAVFCRTLAFGMTLGGLSAGR